MKKTDNSKLLTNQKENIHSLNKLLYNKTESFIKIISIKLLQISSLQKYEKYRVYNDNIIIDNRSRAFRKMSQMLIDDNEKLYNFIRINVDHCINVSQIILSNINNMTHENIYNKQFRSNALLMNLDSFDYKMKILFTLTNVLSETISGLNNLELDNYYNLLIWDIKKIIMIYVLNNLKYLFKYFKTSATHNIDYNNLLKIQNNVMYDVSIELNTK